MNKTISFLVVLLFAIGTYANNRIEVINIGDDAPNRNVKMLDVSGENISLNDVAEENGLVVIFSSNTCPFVKQWEKRYFKIRDWTEKNKIGMILVNSNCQNRNNVDSFEKMKSHAKQREYEFYYVVDKESKLANSFGAKTTPHVFLFDKNMKLFYKGAIDDNYKSEEAVKNNYLKNAIESMVKNEKPIVEETKPVGCSIKRKLN